MSYANNVKTTLNASVSTGATSVQVVKASSPYNDPPTSGKITLMDSLTSPTKIEILSYTGRTDNTTYWTLTGVTKAQESTSDQSWSSGDNVVQSWTAGDANTSIGVIPFYKSDGSSDTIALTGDGEIPFYVSAGTADHIGLV